MRISRTRHIKANLGNYESFDFGATVTVDHNDLGISDEQLSKLSPEKHEELVNNLSEFCQATLEVLMEGEIKAAADMSMESKSIVKHLTANMPSSQGA